MIQSETKTVLDLNVGDIVREHGAFLKIVGLNQEWNDARTGRLVRNWLTECVAMEIDGYVRADAQFRGWVERGEFNVQGNEFATVNVVTDSTVTGA